jgi:hypothetical protein
MALSRKRPTGYPEISLLSFNVLALLASLQHEMRLNAVGPVTFSLQTMKTLACIYLQPDRLGGDICLHSLFNRPDVPQPVIEHVLRHELLHLIIPPREIDGKLVIHTPEFHEEEEALVPWKLASWDWMHLAFSTVLRPDIPNECVWVKKTWRQLLRNPYPSWEMVLEDHNRFADKQVEVKKLMEGL